MTTEQTPGPCPVERADVSALLGLCAVLEGHLRAEPVALSDLSQRLGRRLAQDGLAGADADERGVRQAINDLNHRLRHALGENSGGPTAGPVPE